MVARLFAQQTGRRGPVVVLVHGLGASGRFWRLVAERLSGEARIFCPDLLGFGSSPWPDSTYTVADHVAALDACLDEFGLGGEPVVVAGHSAGSVLSLAWAAARPERYRGLGLISLPVYGSVEDARHRIAALSPMARATVARPELGKLICGVMCTRRPVWQWVLPLLMHSLPANMARDLTLHTWVSYRRTTENVVVQHREGPSATRLSAVNLPVQMLHGRDDRTAPLVQMQRLTAQ
jgi:pimeloyl-ACP methyl ester carboxylesterase